MKKKKRKDNELQEIKTDSLLGIGDLIFSQFYPIAPLQTINSLKKYYTTYREKAFEEKLSSFIQEIENLSEDEKSKFIEQTGKNENQLFEKILRILEQLDEKKKAEIVGKLFKGLVKGKIQSNTFYKLCKLIDQIMIEELEFFLKVSSFIEAYTKVIRSQRLSFNRNEIGTLKILSGYGIVEEIFDVSTQTGQSEIGSKFRVSDLGMILREHL